MKFSITPFEKLGLTIHMFHQPVANPEQGRRRLTAWDELGVADLAVALSDAATMPGAGGNAIKPEEWRERKKPGNVVLTIPTVDWLMAGLSASIGGAWADTLIPLRERLEDHRTALRAEAAKPAK